MKQSVVLLKNCHVISPDFELDGASVLLQGDRIRRIYANGDALPDTDSVVDLNGLMLMPGFVDVHCHGNSGSDFCDGTEEAIDAFTKGKLKEGVTTLLPTTLTIGEDTLTAALRTAADYRAKGEPNCRVPGVHLEGPFINPNCLGAQNPKFVRKPDICEVRRLAAVCPVKKLSYAPEMDEAGTFAAELIAEGITPSGVHSNAGYKVFRTAYDHGLRNLSHFCNQISPLHHREIGLVGAGLLCRDTMIEMICDKIHLCPDMIELIFSIKPIETIQLVSDAMRAAGMPDGRYQLGGLPVVVKDGAARLADSGALAGSILRINTALKNVAGITGLPLTQLVKTTSWNQARACHLDGIGRIEPGYLADFAVLDQDFNVHMTWVGGELRYSGK